MGTLRVSFLSGTVLELAATLGIALVAVTVGVRLVEGGLGLEAGLTVLVLAPELYLPLRNLAAQFHTSADGLAVAERLLDLVEEPARRPAGTSAVPDPREAPVRFEHVSFSYPSRGGLVLDRVDLELEPGETVALTGPSGAGKSTLASLLLLLAEPDAGRVTAGGVDLASCDPGAWRWRIAWVPQRPTLFQGDGGRQHPPRRPGATDADVRAAARWPAPTSFVPRSRTATRRSSATAAGRSRPGSCGGSPSRGPSSATRRS